MVRPMMNSAYPHSEDAPVEYRPRLRKDTVPFMRRQYEPLDALAEETGLHVSTVVRHLVDEALVRRELGVIGALVIEGATS